MILEGYKSLMLSCCKFCGIYRVAVNLKFTTWQCTCITVYNLSWYQIKHCQAGSNAPDKCFLWSKKKITKFNIPKLCISRERYGKEQTSTSCNATEVSSLIFCKAKGFQYCYFFFKWIKIYLWAINRNLVLWLVK